MSKHTKQKVIERVKRKREPGRESEIKKKWQKERKRKGTESEREKKIHREREREKGEGEKGESEKKRKKEREKQLFFFELPVYGSSERFPLQPNSKESSFSERSLSN